MKLAFGCDHAALDLKEHLIAFVGEMGHEVMDFGCFEKESVDYPDFALPVCKAVASGEVDRGILVCYTGIGMSIAANKVKGIRCALCSDPLSARLTREHNDSNVLALGAGIVGNAMAEEIVNIWLRASMQGGRHQQRVDKLMAIEQE